MAIARDATTDGSFSAIASLTHSYSHTCTGSNLLLIVGVAADPGGTDTVTGVTYNSVAMTKIGASQNSTGEGVLTMWSLLGPATGAHNVAITRTGSVDRIYSGAVSYTGVKQSGFPDANNDTSNTGASSIAPSITVVASNCAAVMGAISNTATATASTNAVELTTMGDLDYKLFESSSLTLSPGAYSMTVTGGTTGMAANTMSFAPFVAATTKNLTLLGVG